MENKPYICRICVESTKSIQLISDVKIECVGALLPLLKLLKLLVGFEEIDCTSYYICPSCIEHATSAYKFKILYDTANEKYMKYLEFCGTEEEGTSVETSEYDIKEEELCSDDMPLSFFTSENAPSDNDMKISENLEIDSGKNNDIKPEVIDKKSRKKRKNKDSELWKDQFGVCKICDKLFENKYVLIAHEKRHENKGKFICDECGKGFDSKGCLNRHIKVHTGEKQYQCEECQRCFSSSNNLRLHSRRHNGIKPYLCTQCGKSFSHPTGLSYHLRTHTRERPYTCEVCGKTFLIKCHLDRHKKIHTGERPYTCNQCDRAFIKKIDLQRHEQIHSGEKPYVCKICNKSFLRVLHLNYHMMVHTSERPHRCRHCGKGFIRRYNLTSHIKKSHTEDSIAETAVS